MFILICCMTIMAVRKFVITENYNIAVLPSAPRTAKNTPLLYTNSASSLGVLGLGGGGTSSAGDWNFCTGTRCLFSGVRGSTL